MDDIKDILDEEAAELFSKLHGIDYSYIKDRLSENFEMHKKHEDERRTLLVEVVHVLSSYLLDVNQSRESKIENDTFYHFAKTLEQFIKISPKKRTILIRYRGFPNDPNVTEKDDYEVIYGNTIVDSAIVSEMIKRLGNRMAQLPDQLSRAFRVFSSHNIYTLYIKIPEASAKQKDRFYNVLRALSRYKTAVETNSPIVFIKEEGEKLSFPLMLNESGLPDENLTLLAIANNLKPQTIKLLVDKIGKSSLKDRYMSSYNAIFSVEKLRGKLVRPPIEVNNVIWLMSDQEKEIVSKEKAEVAQFAIESVGGSAQKAAKVLKSVYGNDYDKIDSKNLDERLRLSSNLLNSIEKKSKSQRMEKEILGNIETRLEQVHEQVFDDLFTQKEKDEVGSGKKLAVFGRLHEKLLDTVTFFKSRIDTKKKMREIVHRPINFSLKDFETLAKDFDISIEEAKKLTEMLKECFDEHGRFRRGVFKQIIPDFFRYERKIFEFLWHYLKDYIHKEDRTVYLNSLQLLIAKMQKPKLAIRILLSDFCQNTKAINYSDSKALMLCSILIQKYSKGLIDLEITPEDILKVSAGLEKGIANYTAWRIDKDQNSFFDKMQTIHHNLVKRIDSDRKEELSMPLSFFIALEREAYIFFSLVGGSSAHSIVLSAVKEYGDPDSAIYHGKQSKNYTGGLLKNLRIAIRGLGRVGGQGDLPALDEVCGNEDRLSAIVKTDRNKLQVNQIMNLIEDSKRQIIQRG